MANFERGRGRVGGGNREKDLFELGLSLRHGGGGVGGGRSVLRARASTFW